MGTDYSRVGPLRELVFRSYSCIASSLLVLVTTHNTIFFPIPLSRGECFALVPTLSRRHFSGAVVHNVGGCVCVCTQEVEHCFDRSLSDRCCHRVAAAIAEDARLGRVRVTRVLWYLRCHHRAGFTPVCIVGFDFRGRIGDNRGGRGLTREYRRAEFDVV